MSTGIDYLDETWSPITGCSGKGCKAHCWAREIVKRFYWIHGEDHIGDPDRFSHVQFHPDRLDKPLHWKKPRRVGVAFMGDWMDTQVRCEWIDRILEVVAACPHQFFSLTKQPQNLEEKIYGHCPESPARELGGGDYLPNLWNGVSITDQEDADRMIPELLKVPGKRWVSVEPMLGPVELKLTTHCADDCPQGNDCGECTPGFSKKFRRPLFDWAVVGCESGPKRRPCPHEWMIDVVRQCKAAGVPVWVKQVDMGKRASHDPAEWPEELRVREK